MFATRASSFSCFDPYPRGRGRVNLSSDLLCCWYQEERVGEKGFLTRDERRGWPCHCQFFLQALKRSLAQAHVFGEAFPGPECPAPPPTQDSTFETRDPRLWYAGCV